jgi:hypothetical protein
MDDRLPVGRPHRLRHRYRRVDAELFRLRPDGEYGNDQGHQDLAAVLQEVERLGIPRVL